MALLRYTAFSTIRFLTLPTVHHFSNQKLNKRFAGERLHHYPPGPNVLPSTPRTKTRRIFVVFSTWIFFWLISVDTFRLWLNADKSSRQFTRRPTYSYNLPPWPVFIIKADCVLFEVKETKREEAAWASSMIDCECRIVMFKRSRL